MKVEGRMSVLVTALLLLTVSAWSENKKPVYLVHPTSVGGKMLPAGSYTARWEGAGEVQLKICQGKKEFVSVPARIVQLSSAAAVDDVVIGNEGGAPSLLQIKFGGKKFALQIAGEAGGNSSGGAAK